jgi:hypothetical protein
VPLLRSYQPGLDHTQHSHCGHHRQAGATKHRRRASTGAHSRASDLLKQQCARSEPLCEAMQLPQTLRALAWLRAGGVGALPPQAVGFRSADDHTHRAPVPDMAAEEPHQGTARPSVSLSGLGSSLSIRERSDLLPPRGQPSYFGEGFVEAL